MVITNDELKAKLRVHCWDQVQITSCSHLVVVLAKIEEVRDYEGEVRRKFNRRDLPKDMVDAYIIKYANHQKEYFSNDFNTFSWTSRQTYIALGNMMTAAAVKGVDSCPIEGFDKEDVEKVLNLDTKKYQVSVILPLGYRVKEQSIKQREKLEDIIEFIN